MHLKCHPVTTPDEMKGDDPQVRHFAVTADGKIIGTCRVRVQGSAAKVERMAVLKDWRSKGVGQVLMRYLLLELPRSDDIQLFKVSAQVDTVPFYEGLGFRTRGPEYIEAGLPHYAMIREL